MTNEFEELKKKLRILRKENAELRKEKTNSDRIFKYIQDVLYRYENASWEFNERTLMQALNTVKGMFVGDW